MVKFYLSTMHPLGLPNKGLQASTKIPSLNYKGFVSRNRISSARLEDVGPKRDSRLATAGRYSVGWGGHGPSPPTPGRRSLQQVLPDSVAAGLAPDSAPDRGPTGADGRHGHCLSGAVNGSLRPVTMSPSECEETFWHRSQRTSNESTRSVIWQSRLNQIHVFTIERQPDFREPGELAPGCPSLF